MKYIEILLLWAHYILDLMSWYRESRMTTQISIAFLVTSVMNISIIAFLVYC